VSEPVWLEPYPDTNLGLEGPAGPDARYEQREAVELAFIAALQHLPARQRAVLILRDVLGFSARETAAVLGTTPVAVDSALQRAHKTVQERLPSQTQQQTLRLIGDDELSRLVGRYVDAVDAMLAEDARMAMPPLPSWYGGRDQVAAFLRGYALADSKRWRLLPTSANDSPHWWATSGRRRPRRSCRGASTSSPCGDAGSKRSRRLSPWRRSGVSVWPSQSRAEGTARAFLAWDERKSGQVPTRRAIPLRV
jgi:hypothetical protein